MLVIAGRPVELDAHLERLETSLATLYGAALPAAARGAVLEGAGTVAHGKLRVTVGPGRGRVRIDAGEVEPAAVFPGWERNVSLHSITVAGGLGCHKWADRRLLEKAESALSRRQLPLLLDADGSVLEASRASVFSVAGGLLLTPPSDGRILPSIARRQAIEAAREAGIEVRERTLGRDDLQRGEAFLTGSVRGVEPVRSLDGAALPPPGSLSARVADGLRRRWGLAAQAEPVAAAAGGRPAGPPAR